MVSTRAFWSRCPRKPAQRTWLTSDHVALSVPQKKNQGRLKTIVLHISIPVPKVRRNARTINSNLHTTLLPPLQSFRLPTPVFDPSNLPTNMIFSRIISLILRVSQFVFAAIVLGLTAYFVYKIENPGRGPRGRSVRRDPWGPGRWRDDDWDPLGRLIFALVWSSLSIIFAIIWAIPTTFAMKGFISDFSKLILLPFSVHLSGMLIVIFLKSSLQVGPPSSVSSSTGSTTQAVVAHGHGAMCHSGVGIPAANGVLPRPFLSCP